MSERHILGGGALDLLLGGHFDCVGQRMLWIVKRRKEAAKIPRRTQDLAMQIRAGSCALIAAHFGKVHFSLNHHILRQARF